MERAQRLERPTPLTYPRAATAIIRCRELLEGAVEELALALGILVRVEDGQDLWPLDPLERSTYIPALEELLGTIETAERGLRDTWAAMNIGNDQFRRPGE